MDHMTCLSLVAAVCVGILLLYILLMPSPRQPRQPSSDKERRISVELAKRSSKGMMNVINPLYNVAAVLVVAVITLLLQVFTIMYAVHKLTRPIRVVVSRVAPRFSSQTATHRYSIISGFGLGNLTSIKTSIEYIVQLIFLPFTIPVLIFKKIFTKPTLEVTTPFIMIFILIDRLLKHIARRR